MHNEIHKRLTEMAARRGWNEESQIFHLCCFLQELNDDKPWVEDLLETEGILNEFSNYLENAAEDEDKAAHDDELHAQSLED